FMIASIGTRTARRILIACSAPTGEVAIGAACPAAAGLGGVGATVRHHVSRLRLVRSFQIGSGSRIIHLDEYANFCAVRPADPRSRCQFAPVASANPTAPAGTSSPLAAAASARRSTTV